MKLNERLATLPEDEYVYLGTVTGSGWIWIARRKEMEEHLDFLNAQIAGWWNKQLTKCANEIDRLQAKIIQTRERLKTVRRTSSLAADLRTTRNSDQARLKRMKTRLQYVKKYIKHWTDLQDREVKREDSHTVETDGIGILVEGDESGSYWMLSELEKAQERKAATPIAPMSSWQTGITRRGIGKSA